MQATQSEITKKADWSARDWDTFTRLALGGALTGVGVGSVTGLLGQFRALQEAAGAEDRVKDTVTEVPILRRMKSVEQDGVVKSAFAPIGPAGGWGMGAAMVTGAAGYSVMQKLFQMLRNAETKQQLKDAQEGYEQRVVAKHGEPLVKNAFGGLAPAEAPNLTQMGAWSLWSGIPIAFLLSAFGSRRALEKAFPGATSKVAPSEKALLPYVKEVDTSQKEVPAKTPDREDMEKTAAAAILPLICVLGNPNRVKSACALAPWLDAYRATDGNLMEEILIKNASLGVLAAAAEPCESVSAEVLAGYDLCKNAIAAPGFLRCLAAEFMELCPHQAAGVLSSDVSDGEYDGIIKTAGALGKAILFEVVQDESGVSKTPADEMTKIAAVAVPAELSIVNAVKQLVASKKRKRSEVKPKAENNLKPGLSSRDAMRGNLPSQEKNEAEDADVKDPVDAAMSQLLGQ